MINYQLLQSVVLPRPLCHKVSACKRPRQLHCINTEHTIWILTPIINCIHYSLPSQTF